MALQLHDLLAKGYFPKELPPPFSTDQFAHAMAGPGAAPSPGFANGAPTHSALCSHNLVRSGGLRRLLGLPNPVQFYRLADHITNNWQALQSCAKRSPFSLTIPVESKPDRAISPDHDLSERGTRRAELRAHGRFILKADVSRFFPSIYTHSLPWALMGKSAAKAAHVSGGLKGSWEDHLDMLVRSVNRQQTVGIPIGADTSRLLAEVVLGRIDEELGGKFRHLRGIRYIDDYEFVTTTRSRAEEVLAHLQHLLSQFELALNPSKTGIQALPVELEHRWTSAIRLFAFRSRGPLAQRTDLVGYFDLVFDFFNRFPDEGLLKYAVGRLRSEEVEPDNWPLLENLLNQCVLIEPACIPQVCDQVLYYESQGLNVQKDLWSSTLNTVVCEQLPLGHASEAAWAMWMMKTLAIQLVDSSAKEVGACDDSVAALMGLGLAANNLGSLVHLQPLRRFRTPEGLTEDQWLLCYQGNLMEWLGPGGRAWLRQRPPFDYLESQSVSFFDIGVPPPQPVRTAVGPGGGGGGY